MSSQKIVRAIGMVATLIAVASAVACAAPVSTTPLSDAAPATSAPVTSTPRTSPSIKRGECTEELKKQNGRLQSDLRTAAAKEFGRDGFDERFSGVMPGPEGTIIFYVPERFRDFWEARVVAYPCLVVVVAPFSVADMRGAADRVFAQREAFEGHGLKYQGVGISNDGSKVTVIVVGEDIVFTDAQREFVSRLASPVPADLEAHKAAVPMR